MKLKVTLRRGGRDTDLLITCDAAATVGEVAAFLHEAHPDAGHTNRPPGDAAVAWSLSRPDRRIALSPTTPLAESGLRSGEPVQLVPAGAGMGSSPDPVARAVVVAGPDVGRTFDLLSGSNTVGRSRECTVRLTDPMVSREHARINVTDAVEIIDLGSSNGILVGGSPAERTPLPNGTAAQLGDTELRVDLLRRAATEGRADPGSVAVIRSPRLVAPYDGVDFAAPELPTPPQPQRFPLIALILPVLIGGALYLVTRQLTSLLFLALSPLLMLGNYIEQRFAGRALSKRQLKEFRADLDALVAEVEEANRHEVATRLVEHPSSADCLTGVRERTSLLWTRRTDSPGFAEIRLGVGSMAARNTVSLPDGRRGPRAVFQELRDRTRPLGMVHGAPVVAAPLTEGALGFAGPRTLALAAARSAVAQFVTLHSPDDLVVAAVTAERTAQDWDWLKWLPHCGSAASPLVSRPLVTAASDAVKLLGEIEALIADRGAARTGADDVVPLPVVVLVVESDAPAEFARLVSIAETGWRAGVAVVWIAPETAVLPAACRVYVELRSQAVDSRAGYLHTGEEIVPLDVDLLRAEDADDLARRLAPLVDLSARTLDATDLPRAVSLLSLIGTELADAPEAVIERWTESSSILSGPRARIGREPGTLKATIGVAAGDAHAIDLRAHGPHALVGGTTGSGKSELLQTWILAMAANHSPQRLTFLLVDYKGGAAFAECNHLPHTVGLVTDLNPKGVRRALESLRAELRHREHVLSEHGAKDLAELEKLGRPDVPPSLVLVVDEFAALVTEVPEFVDGVVDAAQRGRSLGIHLILATQRPAGVIKGSLRANTNLRLALRVADVDDSHDVIGSDQAAYFDQDTPGRAVSKTGPGRLVAFQTAYVGGHTDASSDRHDIAVEELTFGAARPWVRPAVERRADPGPADISRLVQVLQQASALAELPAPRRPWLPDLAGHYDLSDRAVLPNLRVDDQLVLGMLDDPDRQQQVPAVFYPDRAGNLAVFGTGGSGKSTLLRTLAVAAGFTFHGGPCHVYGLDFGSRGLEVLERLPHVGSIVPGADDERVQRLLSFLRELVEERALRYAQARVDTITEYRRAANRPAEPRILLLVDGIAAFRQAYESAASLRWWETFIAIAQGGRSVGVHIIVSADRPAALSSVLASSIQQRIVLRMADPFDYDQLNVPKDVLDEKSPPGRGILDGLELQVAVLGRHSDIAHQAVALEEFGRQMRRAGAPEAPPISRLAEVVPESSLPSSVHGRPCLGLASTGLAPFGIPASGTFVISGPPGSGRTTALRALAHAQRRWQPDRKLILLAGRRTQLAVDPVWNHVATGSEAVRETVTTLIEQLRERLAAGEPIALTVAIEGLLDLIGSSLDSSLTDLAKLCDEAEAQIAWEGDPSAIPSGSFGVAGLLKASRAGIALSPDPADGLSVFRTSFPTKLNRADFPPGRALLVGQGRTELVQVMLPD